MLLLRLVSLLSLRLLYGISDLMFLITYHVIRYRRDVVDTGLRRAFPDKSSAELKKIARKFYANFCDYAVETLKLMRMSRKEVYKRVVYKNPEVIESFARQGQPMIYFTSHQFNWEWLLAGVCLYTTPPVYYVYQTQSSKFFDTFSNHIRKRFGAQAIMREKVGREAVRLKGTLHSLAILADQFPGVDSDKRYWTQFLNQETAFYYGINHLAVLTQYPVIFFVSRKVRRGYYECELIKIAEPPYAKGDFTVIENYVKATEKIIQEQPEGWLWSHKRWKRTKEEMGDI